ncbi:PREDICTED: uncharacterized protein LOC109485417 [Branchiostoma belcheri]|uniref:Uncharacterized protein LOC109485417 n=1 Tax=Branchiostoma belcheri TaxID=7741 RepID=A0A6P5A518_BRABE|nr:PREDICTED: uncharacterized protein LOC109485417 [Branchiostoma belcheri]
MSVATEESRPATALSRASISTWEIPTPHFPHERVGRGRVLFTGVDGMSDYRVNVPDEVRHTGIGTMSPEGTSEVLYLWRAARGTPFPLGKHQRVGEIGWAIPELGDKRALTTNAHFKLGEFREACENSYTHRYQNPWGKGKDMKATDQERGRTAEGGRAVSRGSARPPTRPVSTIGDLPSRYYRPRITGERRSSIGSASIHSSSSRSSMR